jgi:dual oxidase
VVEEILDSQRPDCPIEYFNIPVPNDHPFLQGKESLEMPFPRTRYDSSTDIPQIILDNRYVYTHVSQCI